jgi:hypothetical protein
MEAILIFSVIGFVYFIPSIAAKSNKHRSSDAILLVNFFFGWTALGWLIALIWAFTGNRKD